jgi:hypothetical protein
MHITEETGDGTNQLEGDKTPGNNASSDPNMICGALEGLILSNPAQEQSYMTTHRSFGPLAESAYFATPSEV